MRRPSRHERGAALLLVLVAVAVVTALAADLAYETRVRLQIAANARDELRASALAQSGVSMARLVLTFQAELDQTSGAACSVLQQLTGGASGTPATGGTPAAGAPAAGGGAAPCPRPQLWNVVPVGSMLTDLLFPPEGDKPGRESDAAGPAAARAPGPEGLFQATIEDEGQKVNVQLDALQTSGRIGPQVEALLQLTCDPKWDPLFDREDASGQRWNRQDVLIHLRDFVNSDASSSSLNVSYPGGGGCSFVVPSSPFEQGFGDKNAPYQRGQDHYKVKGARLDSLEELHLVAGVSEPFMAAFGDQLTVYLPTESGMNVNTNDPRQQVNIAKIMADPSALAAVNDPAFAGRLQKALSDVRMGGFLTITPVQFANLVQALGVKVRTEYLTQNPKNFFTDRSLVFRIKASGTAGDVTRRIDAVVSFDPRQNQVTDPSLGQPVAGRLIRWREE